MGALEVTVHRLVWTCLILFVTTIIFKKVDIFTKIINQKKKIFILFLTSVLIFLNWGTWIYAISINKIIDASYIQQDHDMAFGEIKAFSKDELLVSAKGGYISINKLQLEGKKIITKRDLFNSNSEFKDRLLNNLGLN